MSKLRYVFALIFTMCISFSWSQFIENNGQWIDHKDQLGEDIDFKLEMAGVNVYFRPEGIVYHFHHKEDKDLMSYTASEKEMYMRGDLAEIGYKVYFFRLDFDLIGANKSAPRLKIDEQQEVRNYYFGHCPNGITDVKSYKSIVYENIYPNIDLKYLIDNGKLKYEFILHPGANPSDIRFTYRGAENLNISEGKLMIKTAYNSLSEDVPYTYYANSGKEIKSSFVLDENDIVSFNLNAKSINEDIVIDPAISWATYYNPDISSGFHANSVYDSQENLYTAFATYSAFWPVINAGAGQYFDATRDGITDLTLTRFNANKTIQWSTYFGGNQGDYLCGTGGDYGKTIDIDDNDFIYLAGYASSNPTTFPTLNSGAPGAFYMDQTNIKGGDNSFVTKFSPTGVLQWSTLYQHQNVSTSGAGIRINGIVCSGDKVYFTGQTYRFSGFDIPFVNLSGAYNNTTFVGDQDIFLGRFSSDCVLEWSTYFNGGNPAETGYKQGADLTVDSGGNLILVSQASGADASAYLLNPGGGAFYQGTNLGNISILITKFNTSRQVSWSTYFGSDNLDRVSEVATDLNNNILVACRTIGGNNMPTQNPGGGAFYHATKQSPGTWSSDFSHDGGLMKFSSTGGYLWGTYVGGTGSTNSTPGISSDSEGNIHVVGYTNSIDFPTQFQAGSYNDNTNDGGMDLILMKFNSSSVLDWSTYYGGADGESNYGVKINTSTIQSSCGYKQFFIGSTNSLSVPLFDYGSGAYYEPVKTTSSVALIMYYEDGSTGSGSIAPTGITDNQASTCPSESHTLTIDGGVLDSGDSWQWYSESCGGTPVGSGTSINVSPASTTTYYVRAEGPCGMTGCTEITLTISPVPGTPNVSSNDPVCIDGTIQLNTDPVVGATYSWTGPNGFTSTDQNPQISNATLAMDGTYSLVVTVSGCSSASAGTNVSVEATPVATFEYEDSPYCTLAGNATVTFVGAGEGGVFSSTAGLVINSSTGQIDLGASTPNSYTVTNTIAAGTCPQVQSTASITITDIDDASFSYNMSSYCAGGLNEVPTVTGVSGGTFSATPVGLSIDPSTGSIDLSSSTSGDYEITYTTVGSCSNSATFDVSILEVPDAPVLTDNSATVCEGEEVTITVNNPIGGVTYSVYDAQTGGTLLGTAPYTFTPSASDTYFVEAENAANCSSVSVEFEVVVNPLPVVTSGGNQTICPGDDVMITVAAIETVDWSTGQTGNSIIVSPEETTTYTASVENAEGCINSVDIIVTVLSDGSVVAQNDQASVHNGSNININVLTNDSGFDGLPSIITNPISGSAFVETDGTITYMSEEGFIGEVSFSYVICSGVCSTICDTALVTIQVTSTEDPTDPLEEFIIPEAFSPNGDGSNDLFELPNLHLYPNTIVIIFNRWGAKVFESDNYQNDWQGISQSPLNVGGDELPEGTYYYLITMGGDLNDGISGEVYKGYVYLKR